MLLLQQFEYFSCRKLHARANKKSCVHCGTYLGTTTSNVVKYSESRMKCSFFTRSAKFRVSKLPVCFFSIFCRLLFKLLYAVDLVFKSVSIWPTCLLIMSAMFRKDCLIGYLAKSHWNFIRYVAKSPRNERMVHQLRCRDTKRHGNSRF